MKTLQSKTIFFVFAILFSTSIYSQNKEQKNIITIKKDVFSSLLIWDNNSKIFNQDKPSSNLFNHTFSDYNIGYQRKIGKRFFIGLDYYHFDAFNDIDPISLRSLLGFERDRFVSQTNIQLLRLSGHYTILDRKRFAIRANLYIPIFERRSEDYTLVYHEEINKDNLAVSYIKIKENKFFLGIVTPEAGFDFLYKFAHLEAGIATSWNYMLTPNESSIRCAAVLNIKF